MVFWRSTDSRIQAQAAATFLSRLSAVLPEVGYGSTAALLQEYERVIRAAEPAGSQTTADEGSLAQPLRELFPEISA